MDARQKRTKFDRATHEQLQFYVNFCRKHPAMLRNKGGDANLKRDNLRLWEEATQGLNSLRGPTRTSKKWRDTFCMWKSQLMCRSRRLKALKNSKSSLKCLTDFEQLALDTFGVATVKNVSNNQSLKSSSPPVGFLSSTELEDLIDKTSASATTCEKSTTSANPLANSTDAVANNQDFTKSPLDIKLSPASVEETTSLHTNDTQLSNDAPNTTENRVNYSTQELFGMLIEKFEQTENVNKNLANSLSKVGEGLLAVAKAIEEFTKIRHTK